MKKIWLASGIAAFLAGFVISTSQGSRLDSAEEVGAFVCVLGALWVIVPAICVGAWRLGSRTGESITRSILLPLPSIAEIEYELHREWGRPPTVEELAAVHSMLISRRHEDQIQAGIGIGALYLIDQGLTHHG